VSLHQLLFQNVGDGLQLEIVHAGEHNFAILLVELDVRFRILQIVALVNFF
jgi:hypothetical protein